MKKLILFLILLLMLTSCSPKTHSYDDVLNLMSNEDTNQELRLEGEIIYPEKQEYGYGLLVLKNQPLTNIYFESDQKLELKARDVISFNARYLHSFESDSEYPIDYPVLSISDVEKTKESISAHDYSNERNRYDYNGYKLIDIYLDTKIETNDVTFNLDTIVTYIDEETQDKVACVLYSMKNNSEKTVDPYFVEAIVLDKVKLEPILVINHESLAGYVEPNPMDKGESTKANACFLNPPTKQFTDFRFGIFDGQKYSHRIMLNDGK